MAGICTITTSPRNCSHRVLTVTLDGVEHVIHMAEGEVSAPLTTEEAVQFIRLGIRHRGIALAALLNRVIVGDEATNVKQYDLMGPGSAIAKTNIGTAYVNVLPGANGERSLIDFTGSTEFRPVVTANLVGTGPFGFRIVKDADNAVLYENASVALTGERELDPGWQAIPAGFTGLEVVRLQAKSTVGSDDPVIRRASLLVR
jgi:hypothetical protein